MVWPWGADVGDVFGVIRSTTLEGRREGGIRGAGGAGAAAGGACGVCAVAIVGIVMGIAASTAHVTNRNRSCLRISPPLWIRVFHFGPGPQAVYTQPPLLGSYRIALLIGDMSVVYCDGFRAASSAFF